MSKLISTKDSEDPQVDLNRHLCSSELMGPTMHHQAPRPLATLSSLLRTLICICALASKTCQGQLFVLLFLSYSHPP